MSENRTPSDVNPWLIQRRPSGPIAPQVPARDRHVATAGKLRPRRGGRIEGPEVVEERRARLTGEDDEADAVNPDRFVSESRLGSGARRELGPRIGAEVVRPQVSEHRRPVTAAEEEGAPAIPGHGPGVVFPSGRAGGVERCPDEGLGAPALKKARGFRSMVPRMRMAIRWHARMGSSAQNRTWMEPRCSRRAEARAPPRREPSSGSGYAEGPDGAGCREVSLGAGTPRPRSRCLRCLGRRRTNPGREPPPSPRRSCRRARSPSAGSTPPSRRGRTS